MHWRFLLSIGKPTVLLLLVLLFTLACKTYGQCSFDKTQVEGSNGVFFYVDDQKNYHLMRTIHVPDGLTFRMACPGDQIIQIKCQNQHFTPALPISCPSPMEATVLRLPGQKSCPANWYAIGHTIQDHFLELYRSCYDPTNVRAYFTETWITSKPFYPSRSRVTFSRDNIISVNDEGTFTRPSIFYIFNCIYGIDQQYVPNYRDIVINRGHLTAASDFLFTDQSAATFKYINVVPQFRSINAGNWGKIERWVRSSIPENSALRVITGAIGVLSLDDVTPQKTHLFAYLAGTNRNPVPQWTYKIIWTAHDEPLAVFLTYNNIYEARPAAPDFCHVQTCALKLVETAADGFTFCCDPDLFPFPFPY